MYIYRLTVGILIPSQNNFMIQFLTYIFACVFMQQL